MKKGKLKFYNRHQEVGLVMDFETGKEYKVNADSLKDAFIKDGDNVIFEIAHDKNGVSAINVRADVFKLN